jgi:DNA-binding transcriptional LysR family regulator
MIGGFQRTHPRVRFRLIRSQDESSSVLVEGDADLEITARRGLGPEVHWEPIIREPLLLAVPPRHRLAGRREVRLDEVADDPFIMLSHSWQLRQTCDDLCATAGFTPQVKYEGEDLPMVRGFVTAGLGVAILPAMGAGPREGRRGEHLLAVTDAGAYRTVGIAWPRDRRLLPSAELFRDHVLAAAGRAASR